MSCLTALGDKVDWSTAVFMWDGPDDITRFCQHNQALFELVLKAVFSDNPPTGSGSTSPEVTARQKASYEEISSKMWVKTVPKIGSEENGRDGAAAVLLHV